MKKKEITKKMEQPENQSAKHIKNKKKTVNFKNYTNKKSSTTNSCVVDNTHVKIV